MSRTREILKVNLTRMVKRKEDQTSPWQWQPGSRDTEAIPVWSPLIQSALVLRLGIRLALAGPSLKGLKMYETPYLFLLSASQLLSVGHLNDLVPCNFLFFTLLSSTERLCHGQVPLLTSSIRVFSPVKCTLSNIK